MLQLQWSWKNEFTVNIQGLKCNQNWHHADNDLERIKYSKMYLLHVQSRLFKIALKEQILF